MNISIRAGLVGLVAATALVGCGKKQEEAPAAAAQARRAAPAAEEKVVNVYNWSDYIDPAVLEQFTAETGIKVNYDVFDSNEVLETKLLAGKTGYDVVVPTASFMERQIKAGVFRTLDRSLLPNYGNLDTEILAARRAARPGQRALGEPHVGHHRHRLQRGQGQGDRRRTRRSTAGTSCSIRSMPPSSRTAASRCSTRRARSWPRSSPGRARIRTARTRTTCKVAEDVLMSIRPYIRMIHSSNYIDALANGEICIAVGWSGDVLQSRDRAEEAGQGNVIKYVVPKEGTIMWFDMYAIPADAPHPNNAHAFINYMMKPEVAAANSNFVNYATGNAASRGAGGRVRAQRPGRLSAAGGQGQAVPGPGGDGRVHAPAEPYLDPLHDGPVSAG